jgi:hypothetical protein
MIYNLATTASPDNLPLCSSVRKSTLSILIQARSTQVASLEGCSYYVYNQNIPRGLLPDYHAHQAASGIPISEAEGRLIARIVRFIHRCYWPRSYAKNGDMQIPQGGTRLREGIETARVCRVPGLTADAYRMERLVTHRLFLLDNTIDQV